MSDDKCSTKFCHNEADLTYLGKPFCQDCFEKICDAEDQVGG